MQKLIGVEFSFKPNDVEVYKTGVDEVVSCTERKKYDEQTGELYTVWVCDLNRYTSAEYIQVQMDRYKSLEAQTLQSQIALVELYEMLVS